MKRIGTAEEKQEVEKELEILKAELAKVQDWERRKGEIDAELARVWVKDSGASEGSLKSQGQELGEPSYIGFGSDNSSLKGSSNVTGGPESSLDIVDSGTESAES